MRVLQHRDPKSDGRNTGFGVPHEHINNHRAMCGHKVDLYRQPNTNCDQCWFFWFTSNTEFTQTAMRDYQQGGESRKSLETRFGKKFVKKIGQFVEAVRYAKQIHDELDEQTTEALSQPETFDLVFRADGRQAVVPTGAPSPFDAEIEGDVVDAEFSLPLMEGVEV